MDLSNCAASYSLTVSLVRQTSAPSGYPSTDVPATSTLIHVSSTPNPYPTASYSTPVLPTANATYTGPSPPEFTGAAAKIAGAGMAVLAGAAGIAGLL